MNVKHIRNKNFVIVSLAVLGAGFLTFSSGDNLFKPISYNKSDNSVQERAVPELSEEVLHLPTPKPLKAVYMTSWVAGTPEPRDRLISLVKNSEINSIVIDVKDYSGKISFETSDPYISVVGSEEKRIPDIKGLIKNLNDEGVYTIARISVFQDSYFAGFRPELAVKRKDGSVWRDRKGLSWIDPAAKEYWNYIVLIAKESEKVGFDELNFDYIRFPSDGNMRDIAYDYYDQKVPKEEALKNFFIYLSDELGELEVPISADLFGMTTTNTDDLNIGQVLEYAEPYFDYISPMVYPSHYPAGFLDYKNPALFPYEVVYYSMSTAAERMVAASSTPEKLRPWLQDFDLGADYDAEMVRAQIKASYDAGLTSWMVWNASNRYTDEAYK